MSLQGLVDGTATSLDGARALYGQPVPASGLPSTGGLQSLKTDLAASVDTVPASWGGRGGEGYKLAGGHGVAALDNAVGADRGVGPQVVTASNESRDGRSGMNNVVSDTRAGVHAIAPSTDTPAGKTVLVNHLEGQLDRAKDLLTRSEQRNIALANMIRAAGGGYGARPMGGGGMPMGGGMGMPGGMGGGSPMSAFGGAGGLGGLFTPIVKAGLTGRSSSGRSGAAKGIPGMPGLDRPGLANETRLQKYTRRLSRAITAAFPEITDIGGYRPDSMKWHPNGLALDVMIPQWDTPAGKALGDRVVQFVQAHAQELGFAHALWRQAQHNPDGSSTPMGDRGDANQNHFNHVHIASIGGGYDGY
ncbi:hypothetical protein Mycch_5569 (plasmid) [Mycolicibacterium chubuense NBB4]|uniref:ARB-07466-like C-terminal domain-containing protein n=1 Tax=Mycolicibacterium chubuense (strain NBB4) TaxID=710421 RepID=I4BSH6_MYCCN|nr:hypothetical protein [Mycolicibacterium chubuense]AFM20233.1 hypothetical protein Mycch_5569 [Mycolicibacterium chubuense NBB4]